MRSPQLLWDFLTNVQAPRPISLQPFVAAGDDMAARNGGTERRDYGRGVLLYSLVRRVRPARVLEIGRGRGYSAWALLLALRETFERPGYSLWSVDPHSSSWRFHNVRYGGYEEETSVFDLLYRHLGGVGHDISFVFGKTPKIYSSDMLKSAVWDFIFVDGGHCGRTVKGDASYALSHINPRGVVVFHDYGAPETPEVAPMIDKILRRSCVEQTHRPIPVMTRGHMNSDIEFDHKMGSLVLCPSSWSFLAGSGA